MTDAFDRTALAQTLATVDQRSTIRPKGLDATLPSAALDATLADTTSAQAALKPLAQGLVFGTTIGEGGMAVVRTATQTSLGREVAVKVLRADATDAASPRMLREAWITGALEHPNIVPVHDLGTDERGRPMLVLKRIEGRAWSELIKTRPLEWNLQQLIDVCHAVAFAHSRGILHRDLKPSNIMIGGFGEVYVLDWGIAVSLVDDKTGRLPLAAECSEIAGTLAYMAPEMLEAVALTERTDVYLLGAILYEIATGAPPHLRESVSETLESIGRSQVHVTDAVPEELAAICRRALAKDPVDRYATANELRTAIADVLEHRGSAEIAREAHAQLRELEAHLATPDAEDTEAGGGRMRTYQLFGQARFGFQAALRAWSGNAAARAGLDRALETMATYELDQGDARAASVLVAELSAPPAALTERLARVDRDSADKQKRLARIEADQDSSYGSVGRMVFLVLFGILWSMMPIGASVMPAVEMDHGLAVTVTSVSILVVIGVAIAGRRTLMRTALNRGIVLSVLVALLLHDAVEICTWIMGIDMVTTHMISVCQWAAITGLGAVFLDRALLVPTLGFLVTLAVIIWTPAQRLWAISASLAVVLSVVVYVWKMQGRGRRIAGYLEILRPDA